jgi:hypothetical protein
MPTAPWSDLLLENLSSSWSDGEFDSVEKEMEVLEVPEGLKALEEPKE